MKSIVTILTLFIFQYYSNQSLIPYTQNGDIGLCDFAGKVVLPPQYSSVSFYNEGLDGYVTKSNGMYGLIDKNLKVIFEPSSMSPITKTKDSYILFQTENEASYYSNKTLQLIKKMKVSTSGSQSQFPIGSTEPYENMPSREHVLGEYIKSFKIKNQDRNHFNVVVANNSYFQIENTSENNKIVALFLPKINRFFQNNTDIEYSNTKWIPHKNQYYLVVKKNNEQAVITQEKDIIIPYANYKNLFLQSNFIEYTEEADSRKYVYFINSGKKIKDVYSDLRLSKTILIDQQKFDVFFAEINNYTQHKSQKVYIGENGVQYYKADFIPEE